ncbi:copper amine oxidase N-terminal domain-containing protein [Paenibacillus sp. MMS20-IR301]|uniref:copper amine oxidase N-terminal domain-containing protein n=1 Tax=Paenibacillus sp. MMS20-IR301 TaxID=2895946 RepID=UPI0028E31692|nr:copper amine oxidase N-terminal domain-containing protein [Paenibacillus sp. MMS20-IR301]WNS43539.1 copper amine oxidase N-terminal domain-containing protein [Paenibacillus sp. MMS20-IR301]
MRKKISVFLGIAVISMSIGVNGAFASAAPTGSITSTESSRQHPSVFMNNEKLDIYANVTYAGTTLVPMRPIFEAYGMIVNWDNVSKTVIATKGDTSIQLTHNSYEAYVLSLKRLVQGLLGVQQLLILPYSSTFLSEF